MAFGCAIAINVNTKYSYKKAYTDGYQSAYSKSTQELIQHCSDLSDIVAKQIIYEKSIAECKTKP